MCSRPGTASATSRSAWASNTYSRLPGLPGDPALGTRPEAGEHGTCPGASPECLDICYAIRPVIEDGIVKQMWLNNRVDDVPPIPEDAKLVRLHISGDFDTIAYCVSWIQRLTERPDVKCWAYTKSWRVPALLPYLEQLRALPNVNLFGSVDRSMPDLPPAGWRRAWIDGDHRAGQPLLMRAHGLEVLSQHNLTCFDGTMTYICPEETKRRKNCAECRYCIDGQRNDVTFLAH